MRQNSKTETLEVMLGTQNSGCSGVLRDIQGYYKAQEMEWWGAWHVKWPARHGAVSYV